MIRYAIYTEWRLADGTTSLDDTGARVYATDEVSACETAHRQGVGWGLGYRRDYVGLVAVAAIGAIEVAS